MPVAERKECRKGHCCHISGKGIEKFGSVFTQKMVHNLASSSVQLVLPGKEGAKLFASGTLISPNVVLCAAHSLFSLDDDDRARVEVWACYELAAQAPPGEQWEYGNSMDWTTGKLLAGTPQARISRVLEYGAPNLGDFTFDYAMFSIEWKYPEQKWGTNVVKLPRLPVFPKPGYVLSSELLVIGHPCRFTYMGEPTQAGMGLLKYEYGPHPTRSEGDMFTYAGFGAGVGNSGGGVFNDRGEIVGIYHGSRNTKDQKHPQGPCFFNLQRAVQSSNKDTMSSHALDRLRAWMSGDTFLRSGDVTQNVVLIA